MIIYFSWNEWINLPLKYKDLPRTAQVALTIWDVYGPRKALLVGGTTVLLFGKSGLVTLTLASLYNHINQYVILISVFSPYLFPCFFSISFPCFTPRFTIERVQILRPLLLSHSDSQYYFHNLIFPPFIVSFFILR